MKARDIPAIAGGKPVRGKLPKNFLDYFRPSLGQEEEKEVVDTLRSNWITTGPKTKKFTELFRSFIGAPYAVAVNSCTAGLHLALVANCIGQGDEVITTPFTFVASANVIVHTGAKPVFVDIDSETYNIDPSKIETAITKRTKAIIPVHFAGHPCPMDEILRIAKRHNLVVIEDAAHAVGASYKGRKIGTIGDFTSFSFYATKNMTTAEGGMVTTKNKQAAEMMEALALHGLSHHAWARYFPEASWRYDALFAGFKYNMTDIQSALGIHQLRKLGDFLKKRAAIAAAYNKAFRRFPELVTPKTKSYAGHPWHLYPLRIVPERLKISRDQFLEALVREGIGRSVHFLPLHLFTFYRRKFGFQKGDFPIAEYVGENIFSLPLYPRMTFKDVADVVKAVEKIVGYYRK